MPKIVNTQTNKQEVVGQDELAQALTTGTHALHKGQEVDLVHPDGSLYTVPAESVKEALDSGYKFASQEQLSEFANEKEFGNRPLAAAGAAALDMSTFGLGSQALTKSGLVNPETLKQLEERNPAASVVGDVAGITGSFLAPELGLLGAAEKVGAGITKGVAKQATKALGKTLGETAAHTAGSAALGSFYGLGNVIHEQALGDPNLTAESALSEIGHAALYGGAIGAGLHGMGLGAKAAAPAITNAKAAINETMDKFGVSDLGQKVKDIAADKYAGLSSVVSGVPKEDILAAIKNRGTEAVPLESAELSRSLQNQFSEVEKASKRSVSEVRPLETEKLITNVDPERVGQEFATVTDRLKGTIAEIRQNPDIYPSRYGAKLEQFQNKLKQITTESEPHQVFKALDELKSSIDKNIKYGKFPTPADEEAQALIKGLRREIKASLENTEVFGNAGARQAEYNDAVHEYIASKNDFQKQFMRKTVTKGGNAAYEIDPGKVERFLKNSESIKGQQQAEALANFTSRSGNLIDQIEGSARTTEVPFNKDALGTLIKKNTSVLEQQKQQGMLNRMAQGAKTSGEGGVLEGGMIFGVGHAVGASNPVIASAVGAYQALRYPGQTVQRLAKLEELISTTAKKIEKGAKAVVSSVSTPSLRIQGYVASYSTPMSDEKFTKVQTSLQELAGNPAKLAETLHKQTSNLQTDAPQTVQSMQEASGRAVAFLASKLPKVQQPGPLAKQLKPSPMQVSQFTKYYEAVQNPTSILKDAAAGVLTQESVEAVQTVFPTLYSQMQQSILKQLTEKKDKTNIPYQKRMMLSLLLGSDVDGSMNPVSVNMNQQTLAGSQAKADAKDAQFVGQPDVRVAGLDSLTQSEQALTPMQATSLRKA